MYYNLCIKLLFYMIPIPKYNRYVFIEAIYCSAPDSKKALFLKTILLCIFKPQKV